MLQLLEQRDHPPSVQLELGEEAPLQAVSALHVQAAPRPAGAKVKVDDDQLEDVLEENRRLMDEVWDWCINNIECSSLIGLLAEVTIT
jgi:hypothetical protein